MHDDPDPFVIRGAKHLSADDILDRLDRAGFNVRDPRGLLYEWRGEDCAFHRHPSPTAGTLVGGLGI